MRSTNQRATRFLLKRNFFIGILVFLAVFFVLPFWSLSHIPNEAESIRLYGTPESQTKSLTTLVSTSVMTAPLNLEMMTLLFGGLGFLSALMLMRHLFSRRQCMLHASLPDRREADFLRRLMGYGVLCLAPIVLNFLLYLAIVTVNGLIGYVDWAALLPRFGMLLLINLYGFAMGMLASVLTGTWWAAILAGAVLVVGMEGTALLWNYLAGHYLYTLMDKSFRQLMLALSPVYTLYKGLYRPAEFVWLPGAASILAAIGVSLALCRVRKTEAAEKTLAFGWLHTVMGFLLPLPGGSLLGIILFMSFTTELSLVLGMVLGAVLTYWVCRMVFNQRFCGILRQWFLPAAAAVVLVLGVCALHTDVMGFDRFLPERAKLTAITYRPQGYHTDELITLTSDEALDAAYEWCTLMTGEADSYDDGLITVSTGSSAVAVTYEFNGRTVHRRYPNHLVRTQAQAALKQIIESDDYRQSLIDHFQLDSHSTQTLYLNPKTNAVRNEDLYAAFGVYLDYLSLNREDEPELVESWVQALRKDLQERTFAEKQEDAILGLSLHNQNENDDYSYFSVDIYPGDTHFLTAVYGDQAEAVRDYLSGGYAENPDIVALKVTCSMSRAEQSASNTNERDVVDSIRQAVTPQEASAWVRKAQATSADRYYYMPATDETSYSRLYLYSLSEAQRYQTLYAYTLPEDKTLFYSEQSIPVLATFDFVGE